MSDVPIVAKKAPFPVEVQAGERYFWCACGRSANQPFCDGSHSGTGIAPTSYVAEKDGRIFFCGCKATANAPLCDGSHNRL
jgi:CDGSH-type Zn-finger protein